MKNFMKNLVKGIVKVDLVTGSLNRNDRIGALHRAWGHVFTSHMKGDYYEFGVYKGSSFCESIRQYKEFRFCLQSQLNSSEKWRVDVALQYAQYSPLSS